MPRQCARRGAAISWQPAGNSSPKARRYGQVRDDMPIWMIVVVPILAAYLFYILKNWRSEYKFYQGHNWNYLIDNPAALHMYKGEDSLQTEENRLSNSQRMTFGYPFAVFVVGIIFLGSLFFVYRIQVCDADNLEKCGIKVEDGSVTFGGL